MFRRRQNRRRSIALGSDSSARVWGPRSEGWVRTAMSAARRAAAVGRRSGEASMALPMRHTRYGCDAGRAACCLTAAPLRAPLVQPMTAGSPSRAASPRPEARTCAIGSSASGSRSIEKRAAALEAQLLRFVAGADEDPGALRIDVRDDEGEVPQVGVEVRCDAEGVVPAAVDREEGPHSSATGGSCVAVHRTSANEPPRSIVPSAGATSRSPPACASEAQARRAIASSSRGTRDIGAGDDKASNEQRHVAIEGGAGVELHLAADPRGR